MKIETKTPRQVDLRTWVQYKTAGDTRSLFDIPRIVAVEDATQHAALLRVLGATNRPYCVAILTPRR